MEEKIPLEARMGGLVGASQRVGKFMLSSLEVQLLSDVIFLPPSLVDSAYGVCSRELLGSSPSAFTISPGLSSVFIKT